MKSILTILLSFFMTSVFAQDLLPPNMAWDGTSTSLIVKDDHAWVTPSELTGLTETPSYDETITWLQKLVDASPVLSMTTIGVSAQGREIKMVFASKAKKHTKEALVNKPIILAQAGIHAGEIDGKDAGLMLLRDIAFGDKSELIKDVNFLFIPILSVDGHERTGPYNRVNQRGPINMGWRKNANNLNLNRDYTKIETEGVQAVIEVINEYQPVLYMDLHVTDGADYQYDITYGWVEGSGYSPETANWFEEVYQPEVDAALSGQGHIPGPLMFAFNDRDFTEGNARYPFSPRYSDGYGDVIHVPSILLENHSLKPYKQRVLGTYVFLEQSIRSVIAGSKELEKAIALDQAARPDSIVLQYGLNESLADSMDLKGVSFEMKKSPITGQDYIAWTGKERNERVVVRNMDKPLVTVSIPKAYYIPSQYKTVIGKLKQHGIVTEVLTQTTTLELNQYKIKKYEMGEQPYEGHVRCENVELSTTKSKVVLPKGSVKVDTDQKLGVLAVLLLEPESPDSFLQWGYFHSIFSRTEYIEMYVIEPLAQQMLSEDAGLKIEFEAKMKADTVFANSPADIYAWFYARSPYYDQQWKVYPVLREE
ncbi:MAG: M14 family metallopeptidase [Reichenbachiella sp.]